VILNVYFYLLSISLTEGKSILPRRTEKEKNNWIIMTSKV